MKKLLGLSVLVSMFTLNVFASPEKAQIYEIAFSSMNLFKTDAKLICSGDEIVDWRTEQYDETFKQCLNTKYRTAIENAGYTTTIKSKNLYHENVLLAEFLKNSVLEEHGIKMKKNQYGIKTIDLEAEGLTVEKLREAQYRLESLIE